MLLTGFLWTTATGGEVWVVGRQNADIADRDVAMATTFWLSMGYNFSCMIARDRLFDRMGGFLGTSYPMRT